MSLSYFLSHSIRDSKRYSFKSVDLVVDLRKYLIKISVDSLLGSVLVFNGVVDFAFFFVH